ncbi:hypothetical protein [Saliniramus sp.]|uniref:hypothetical protein n=1 Tax=Saliniramus sp. TaxID=2986772 RepID=UPI002BF75B8B|nr:hypothetical protein [Saliniramus sp.]HMB10294.1 hypothetical protein [Saliniramus sp.]
MIGFLADIAGGAFNGALGSITEKLPGGDFIQNAVGNLTGQNGPPGLSVEDQMELSGQDTADQLGLLAHDTGNSLTTSVAGDAADDIITDTRTEIERGNTVRDTIDETTQAMAEGDKEFFASLFGA